MGAQSLGVLMGYDFGGPDIAAAASSTQLYPFGLPDIADSPSYTMPYPGVIVGITVNSAPVSSSSVQAWPALANAALTAPTATCTNPAVGAQTMEATPNQYSSFLAGAVLGCFYQTTTWTVKDTIVTVWVKFLLPFGDVLNG